MPTITNKVVDDAAPGGGTYFLWDDKIPGFGLRVTPKGAKAYVLQYRMGGRGFPSQRLTIGRHGVWTADEARKSAVALRKKIEGGIDPWQRQRKRKAVTSQALDVALLSTEAAAAYLGRSSKTLENWRAIGGGPPFVRFGTRFGGYRRVDIDAWLASHVVSSTSE